ncbi:MAG: competence protein TfoX [Chloroflexi bacterium]|nr:MAG: competence protein TfoX [Chloroflexota bacterium]MBL1195900.1 TfoX family protein [Chloroflexota bacterium]NOH13192.1 TfoX/Sxy family protein [Chloroflexota bacterium]
MGKKGAKLTPQADDMAVEIVNSLSSVGDVSSRKMFGGYGIFESGSMFALIDSAGQVFFKADDSNLAQFEAAGSEKHVRMPYYAVPANVLEDVDAVREWATTSIEIAHSSK